VPLDLSISKFVISNYMSVNEEIMRRRETWEGEEQLFVVDVWLL
jgi:hypothetical protein